MKKAYILSLGLMLFFLLLSGKVENKRCSEPYTEIGIYHLSIVDETQDINLEVFKRAESGQNLGYYYFKVDRGGNIKKAIEITNFASNIGIIYGFDYKDNLWIGTDDGICYIPSKDIENNGSVEAHNLVQLSEEDEGSLSCSSYENTVYYFGKSPFYFEFPRMMAFEKEKWRQIPVGYSDITNDSQSSCYSIEASTLTIYKSTFKKVEGNKIDVKIESSDWKIIKWKEVDNFQLDSKKIPNIWNSHFLVSKDYYVFASDKWEGRKKGKEYGKYILSYNRRSKEIKYYQNVFPECSDYEIEGPEPHIISGDTLFCQCLTGGYVAINLRDGKIKRKSIGKGKCYLRFYQVPFQDYILLTSVSELYISCDKGENWEKIIDVSDPRVLDKVCKIEIKIK